MRDVPKLVLDFEEITADDGARVGGKALSLGALTAAGFAVPEGFVLTTLGLETVFNDPVLADSAAGLLEDARAGKPFDEVRLSLLRARVMGVPLPDDVSWALLGAHA